MTLAAERRTTRPAVVPATGSAPFEVTPASSDRRLHRLPPDSDVVELLTVGIDVGSATFHTSVSRVVLERRAQALSTRYDVVARETVFVSPVSFTPYRGSEEIDSASVDAAVRGWFAGAGVDPAEVDSGVVILTGCALLRHNARALADRLATVSGRFVCAAAGHHFEAVLAAHGSGAVARSRETPDPVVALDVGGATTKLALVMGGEVQATAAVGVGSRLLAWDGDRRLVRVEAGAVPLAASVGVDARIGHLMDAAETDAVCDRMALEVVGQLVPRGRPERGIGDLSSPASAATLLTGAFPVPSRPFEIVASGGVAEFFDGPGAPSAGATGGDEFGDLGPHLARALRSALRREGLDAKLRIGGQRIRATVIGASQFSTQVSGSTIAVDATALPMHHVPVVRPPLDLGSPTGAESGVVASVSADAVRRRFSGHDVPDTLAVSFRWRGEPTYVRLRGVAEGLLAAQRAVGVARLVVAVDADVASSLGRIMATELGAGHGTVLCLDNLDLADLDYVDLGLPVEPAKVVPVVVKSLLFADTGVREVSAGSSLPEARTQGGPP